MSFSTNLYLSILFCIAFIAISVPLLSQSPTTQDCLGAIPVCAAIYKETTAPSGFGSYSNEINNDISCLFNDNNSIWYTFTVNSSGNFGFIITPNDLNDDYDWGLFDLTNASCDEISTNASILVSCNAAGDVNCQGVTGANGRTSFNIQGGGCDATTPDIRSGSTPFNNFIPVLAGNTYTLMISNFSGSTNGYEIDFGVSEDIGIIDNIPPTIRDITPDEPEGCAPTQFIVEFTESIKCNSINLDNYALSDSEGNRYDIDFSAPLCDVGGAYSREFIISIQDPPTISGQYSLVIDPTNALPIFDLCDNVFSSHIHIFNVDTSQLQEISLPLDTLICDLPSLFLDVTDPAADTYLWQDGTTLSTFIANVTGDYMVTVSNSCQEKEASIHVDIFNNREITIDLGRDTTLCLGVSYSINPNISGDYIYNWSDNNTDATRQITQNGTYRLSVSDLCGPLAEDEIEISFIDLSLDLELGPAQVLCDGETNTLDVTHMNASSYLWNDGSILPSVEIHQGGTYSVTITNACETVSDEVVVKESSCIECHIYIPNIISLSANNSNSSFKISPNCKLETYKLHIFDRWGSEVYTSLDYNNSWDGYIHSKVVAQGVYTYVVNYSYFEFAELIEQTTFGDVLIMD